MITEVDNNEFEMDENEHINTKLLKERSSKPPKKGIIYLSTIPPYMDVTRIREYFEEFGTVCRVYLQLGDQRTKAPEKKKKRNVAKKFLEGWIEFERKHVAKKVARLVNNTRVSDKKRSKQYDYLWNIKYLKNFKWAHLNERLAYEKAARRQKLRIEVQLAKKKSLAFSSNLDKQKNNKKVVNKEYGDLFQQIHKNSDQEIKKTNNSSKNRKEFLSSLF